MIFSQPSAFMLQNEVLKNDSDLLLCYIRYIAKAKRYKIAILIVAVYFQTPCLSFDFDFALIA